MPEPVGLRRRSHDLAVSAADDRVTVLDLNAPDRPPLILEGTAMEIWRLLDGNLDRDALVEVLVDEYDVPADDVAAGVASFLQNLSDLGLLDDGETRDGDV